jgi:hypothetical protein
MESLKKVYGFEIVFEENSHEQKIMFVKAEAYNTGDDLEMAKEHIGDRKYLRIILDTGK